ncbi:MAG: hypothetical protein SFW35_02990 [Chitinophagales bacterium]|nr:hypothetical protein [Chitinophagales bacterium]
MRKQLGEMILQGYDWRLLKGPVKCFLNKDLLKADHRWLKRDFLAGEQLFLWRGLTHGCIGPDGIAVCLVDEETPFFEVPTSALEIEWPDEK